MILSGISFILSESIRLGPSSFQIEAIHHNTSSLIASYDAVSYDSTTPSPFVFSRNSIVTNHYRLSFYAVSPAMMLIAEMRLMVCRAPAPTEIVFTPNLLEVTVDVDHIRLSPSGDIMNCTIIPSLPSSLSMDYDTCTVRGIVHSIINQTFTVTAHMKPILFGSFTIQSHPCHHTLFRLIRQWGPTPFGEMVRIASITTDETVYFEEANSIQQPNQSTIISFFSSVFLFCLAIS